MKIFKIFDKEDNQKYTNMLNLLICGAQRSGTTSLTYYLEEHPEIGFIGDSKLKIEGRLSGFPFASPIIAQSITGESPGIYERFSKKYSGKKTYIATTQPYFMVFPHVPFNLCRHLPDVKLIFILRNPVDTAYSAYCNGKGLGRRKGSFEENLKMEKAKGLELVDSNNRGRWFRYFNNPDKIPLLVDRGFYYQQLIRYYRCFKEEQILVLRFDQFAKNTCEIMQQIMKFLELDSDFKFKRISTIKNASLKFPPMDPEIRVHLREIYAESNQKLFKFLGWPCSLWD